MGEMSGEEIKKESWTLPWKTSGVFPREACWLSGSHCAGPLENKYETHVAQIQSQLPSKQANTEHTRN